MVFVTIYFIQTSHPAKNYHPISLLSIVSNVLERFIFNMTITHISTFINPSQFGFFYTSTAVNPTNQLSIATDVIYFDISKAFDTISHQIILHKLWLIGITGPLWSWFKIYLINHFQRVSMPSTMFIWTCYHQSQVFLKEASLVRYCSWCISTTCLEMQNAIF